MNRIDIAKMAASPREFRNRLIIDTAAGPMPYSSVVEPWQEADFAELDPALLALAGRWDGPPPRRRAWWERPRGHSKTADLAMLVCWLLAFVPRRIAGFACAADQDQARLLRDAIDRLVRLNHWLRQRIVVQRDRVFTDRDHSQLTILAADAATNFGVTPDFVVLDEITHWQSRDLWDGIFSAVAKRGDNCIVACITNAGLGAGSSWQWQIRETVRDDPAWHFSRLDGPQARWITPALLDEQRRMLSPSAYKRLWGNVWQTSAGDALDESDIAAAVRHELRPMLGVETDFAYVGGLDLSTRRDRTALVVVGCHFPTQRLRLAYCQSWAPGPNGQIDLNRVGNAVLEQTRKFNLAAVAFDPWQAELMGQQLRRADVNMVPMPFVGKNLDTMATTVSQVFRERRIDLYPDAALIADLGKLMIVEKSFGFKLEAPRDKSGHADRATALAIALPAACQMLTTYTPYIDDGLEQYLQNVVRESY